MNKGFLKIGLLLTLSTVLASANVTIQTESFQQDQKSKKDKWVKVDKVVPGTEIKYLNTVRNEGTELAEKLIIVNNVSKHVEYLGGTAKCDDSCNVSYSVDEGKTFDIPSNLYVEKNGKKVQAQPKDYTTIKWEIISLEKNKSTNVEYKVKIK